MHRRDPAAEAAVTRRWAGLAGVVAGLAGLGVAGLIAGLIAPGGSPVAAVGELIIVLLPALLVNFGKETLGFADKPILLGLIILGVLALRSGRPAWSTAAGSPEPPPSQSSPCSD